MGQVVNRGKEGYRFIDSTMAVKVQGIRFDIWMVEELGVACKGGGGAEKGIGGVEDYSSRAPSDGGNSVAAVAEGSS
jgi:hypothetical protein